MEAMCALLAAVSHDLDHPGVNQNFLVATKSHLAAMYNVSLLAVSPNWHFSLSHLLFPLPRAEQFRTGESPLALCTVLLLRSAHL